MTGERKPKIPVVIVGDPNQEQTVHNVRESLKGDYYKIIVASCVLEEILKAIGNFNRTISNPNPYVLLVFCGQEFNEVVENLLNDLKIIFCPISPAYNGQAPIGIIHALIMDLIKSS